jgi:alpha-maltose-1-phosphate synthase
MKKRVALVRGPNLNSWEMQNFSLLSDTFDFVGFTSHRHNFDISRVPFEVRKLFSAGQSLRARFLRNFMNHLYGDYHDLQGLQQALKGFDIVHSAETSYYCTYQAAKAKEKLKFKLVVTVWENIPFLYHSPVTEKNKTKIFAVADLFLTVSNRAKEVLILEGAPEKKIKVQMPGIDVEHFRPMEKDQRLLEQFDCNEDDLIVLYVANLYREKGIFDLIFAFRRLIDRLGEGAKIKLLFAGRGRERTNVMKWIKRLHLENNSRLIGHYPYAMMPRIHNLADVFVLPSLPMPAWQEQFGYVLVESMACGKPVISTLSGSIPEVVADAGVLVPSNDFTSLSNTLERLLTNKIERLEIGRRCRTRAEKVFDIRIVSNQFRHHYDSIMS